MITLYFIGYMPQISRLLIYRVYISVFQKIIESTVYSIRKKYSYFVEMYELGTVEPVHRIENKEYKMV